MPVNTPLPTAAGWPWIWTVAFGGLTVPRTTTLLAAITLPLVGDVTTTVTGPVAAAFVELEVDEPQPESAIASAASAASRHRSGVPLRIRLPPITRGTYQEPGRVASDAIGGALVKIKSAMGHSNIVI